MLLGLVIPWPKPKPPYRRAEELNECFFIATLEMNMHLGLAAGRTGVPTSHALAVPPGTSAGLMVSVGRPIVGFQAEAHYKPITSQEAQIMVFKSIGLHL